MSLSTRGYLSGVGAGGGGGGAGPSDLIVPFTMIDNAGVRVAGLSTVTLAANIEIGIGGAPYGAALGSVTEVGEGDYFYTFDEDEAVAPGSFFKIELAGYFDDKPFSLFWGVEKTPTNTDLSLQITNAVSSILGAILSPTQVGSAVWGSLRASYNDAGTFGEAVRANLIQWLGDTPAALTATSKLVQIALMRWRTDDANGTPLALDSNKVQASGAPSFNSDDRTNLQGLRDDYTTARAAKIDHLDEDVSSIEVSVDNDAVAAAVFATVLEGSHTFGDLVRGQVSAAVGPVQDFDSNLLVFRSINGAKIRWQITTDSSGRLVCTPVDLTQ